MNRLASVYDWSGVSDASASRTLQRLEAMVERPLVDIAPVYTSSEPAPLPVLPPDAGPVEAPAKDGRAMPTGPAAWMPSWGAGADPEVVPGAPAAPASDAAGAVPVPAPPAPARPRPVGLRVEQTLAGSATPTRTIFGLRRTYGCFWLTL